ncbi:hypothetical protein D3C80_1843590 [compost metagenome]
MGGRIERGFPQIVAAPDNFSVTYDYRTDRHFTQALCFTRFGNRLLHPKLMYGQLLR